MTSLSFFYATALVEPLEPLDPSNAFTAPFRITNDGQLAIHDVTVWCSAQSLVIEGGTNVGGMGVPANKQPIGELTSKESETMVCALLGPIGPNRSALQSNQPLRSADVVVVVEYRPSFWPWRTTTTRRFRTTPDVDGKLRWYNQAISEL
jgi:hypothetical protein